MWRNLLNVFDDNCWLTTLCTQLYPGTTQIMGDVETAKFVDVFTVIVEEFRLTRCVRVCFADTEENRAERHKNRSTRPREINTWNKGKTCLGRS